jgi:hypothetical protein
LKEEKGPAPEQDVLTLGAAAKYCRVSQTTIKRLVASGVVPKEGGPIYQDTKAADI